MANEKTIAQITGLSKPDAAGEAIRQTAIITEDALETLITVGFTPGSELATDTLWAAKGDLPVGTANDTGTVLSIGAAGTILQSVAGTPAWSALILDEDDMATDSATQLASQQSIKAYVDSIKGLIYVAADDATDAEKALAGTTYTCDGTADEVQLDLAQTAAAGGKVILLGHVFSISAAGWTLDNCTIDGLVAGNTLMTKGVSLVCLGRILIDDKVEYEQTCGRLWNVQVVATATCISPLAIIPSKLFVNKQKVLDNVIIYNEEEDKAAGGIGLELNCTTTDATAKGIGICSFGDIRIKHFDTNMKLFADRAAGGGEAWINANIFHNLQLTNSNTSLLVCSSDASGAQGTIVENKFNIYSELATNYDVDVTGVGTAAWTTIENEFDCYYLESGGNVRTNGDGNHWIVTSYVTITDTSARPDHFFVKGDTRPLKIRANIDSAVVANSVSIGGYDIAAGHRALSISCEEVVVAEADETKFSHKLPVRINGATYNIMLTVT